jgi:phosphate transport system substrate-binding protein
MKKAGRRILQSPVLALALLFAFMPPQAVLAAKEGPVPYFSDPGELAPVPGGWENQPVRYNDANADADIVVTLDQHLYPMLVPVISEYAVKQHLKIIVEEGTCGISNGMLFSKQVDIGGFCCPPGRLDRFPGLKFHTLGISALAIMVNADNPIENLSSAEIRKIYKGELVHWSQLKGMAGKKNAQRLIQPVTRLHCKLRPGHWRLILPSEEDFTPNIKDVSSISDMISEVAGNVRAIGYEVAWNALYRYRDRGEVRIVNVDGASPFDPGALVSGRYPFFRTYSVTTWSGKGVANAKADELVAYLRRHVGEMDEQYGIVPWTDLKKAGWVFQGDELVGKPVK